MLADAAAPIFLRVPAVTGGRRSEVSFKCTHEAGSMMIASSDTKMGMVDGVEMGISFAGDLSEDQQRGLLEIAGKCPIHRLLTSPVPIQTKLLVPSSLSMGIRSRRNYLTSIRENRNGLLRRKRSIRFLVLSFR